MKLHLQNSAKKGHNRYQSNEVETKQQVAAERPKKRPRQRKQSWEDEQRDEGPLSIQPFFIDRAGVANDAAAAMSSSGNHQPGSNDQVLIKKEGARNYHSVAYNPYANLVTVPIGDCNEPHRWRPRAQLLDDVRRNRISAKSTAAPPTRLKSCLKSSGMEAATSYRQTTSHNRVKMEKGTLASSNNAPRLKSCLKQTSGALTNQQPAHTETSTQSSSLPTNESNKSNVPTFGANNDHGSNASGQMKRPSRWGPKLDGNSSAGGGVGVVTVTQRSPLTSTAHQPRNDEAQHNAATTADDATKRKRLEAWRNRQQEKENEEQQRSSPAGKSHHDSQSTASDVSTSDSTNTDSDRATTDESKSEENGPIIDLTTNNHGQGSQISEPDQSIIDLTAEPDKTHVIFAIDFSGSMKEKDVKAAKGKKISRWDAVFECIETFLAEQQAGQSGTSTCLISVFIFNMKSQVILQRRPLIGDGSDIRKILNRAKRQHKPHAGTGFATGFRQAEQLARPHINDKVVVCFLSDGRPGDHNPNPPPKPTIAYTCKKSATWEKRRSKETGVWTTACEYIENMKKRHTGKYCGLCCLLAFDASLTCSPHFCSLQTSTSIWFVYTMKAFLGFVIWPVGTMEHSTTQTLHWTTILLSLHNLVMVVMKAKKMR